MRDSVSQISAIEPGRRRGRFNIYVDGEFAVAAGEKVVADLGLRIGQPFSPDRLRDIAEAEEARRAMESSLRLLEVRPRAVKEIEQRLRQKGYEDAVTAKVISELKRLELVDDAEFARLWVESRSRSRPKGARLLRAELAQKGVARDEIDEAVGQVSADDELELARRALAPKMGRTVLPEEKAARLAEYQRMASFLQRRGFKWETVKAALAQIFEHQDEDDLESGEVE